MHPKKTFAIEQQHKIYYPKKQEAPIKPHWLQAASGSFARVAAPQHVALTGRHFLCAILDCIFYFASSSWRGPPQNFSNYLLLLDHARHTFARYLIYDRSSSPLFCWPAAQQCSLENTIILARISFFIVRKRFFTIFPVRWVLRALDLIGNYSQLRASFLLLCHYFCYSDSWEHLRPQFFQLVL